MIRNILQLATLASFLSVTSALCTAAEFADKVFLNGSVYTLDDNQPWAEAVAVTGDTIVYVGDNTGARTLVGEQTRVQDLQGKMMLPGFIDTHMHPLDGGAYARALALDTGGTVEEWIAAIGDYGKKNPNAELIFGYGFLATTFGPAGPTSEMIDAVVSDRPVLIMDEGFHGAWANSKALAQLNIDRNTPDPTPGFSYYKRNADGNPTGYLLEGTAGLAMSALGAVTPEIVATGTGDVIDVLNSYGVTSVFDAGALEQSDILRDVLDQLQAGGDMTIRIIGSYFVGDPAQTATAVDGAVLWRADMKGENYHYNTLKLMLDGTVEGRTAAMYEDYQGEPGNRGTLVFTQEETNRIVVGAAAQSVDVHIHALGERAIGQALNAIEAARAKHPQSSSRYTICHVQVITDEDIERFGALDVIAQSTPLWASYDTYGKEFVSEDQFSRFWRFKSLQDKGVRLTWGSDFPASGAGMLGMSPIYQMEIGHTRQEAGEANAPVQPLKSERLELDALIRGYTIDAAYQLHMEDEIGSLEIGKKADIVILDSNLFELNAYDIHRAKVLLTLFNGEVVYDAPRQ